ncbi:MAG: type II toxin-antitoxin system VapC family toxin [Defluviicoccus sp.]|nr:type II toxin-antitoxin system VapC family toxin [Defluviicoccus sp.]MDE0382606.1 type II toxin-antitoxin system VapC family toxin [Defluviicoccus sp.]
MTVLDASGAIKLPRHTDPGAWLAAVLEDETEIIHAPHLMDLEIAQILRRYVARGTLDEEAAANALRRWRDFDVERHPHEPLLDRVWQLRANVSAYDAVYVPLAETLSDALVTGDRRLARVPGLGVAIEAV